MSRNYDVGDLLAHIVNHLWLYLSRKEMVVDNKTNHHKIKLFTMLKHSIELIFPAIFACEDIRCKIFIIIIM